MSDKKRKALTLFFVLRPWGFVLFLLLGAGIFIVTASRIRIPVYTTVETVIEEKNGDIQLNLKQTKFQSGTPVFLYRSRDDHLEKVTEYRVENGCLFTSSADSLPDEGRIYMDVQVDEISLLRHIFTEGGNT